MLILWRTTAERSKARRRNDADEADDTEEEIPCGETPDAEMLEDASLPWGEDAPEETPEGEDYGVALDMDQLPTPDTEAPNDDLADDDEKPEEQPRWR